MSTINQRIWDAWAEAECNVTGHRAAQIALDAIGYAALLDVAEAAQRMDDAWDRWMETDFDQMPEAEIAGIRAALQKLQKLPQVCPDE